MIGLQQILRPAVLRVLRATAFDTTIEHHWVRGHNLVLNTFKHKGYWYHGRRREHASMNSIAKVLHEGDTAIEVGAHIGYISVWLAALVGRTGKVRLFEPDAANRRYLERNVAPDANASIETSALADYEGEADFFVEDLTGQNNSLIEAYDVLAANCALAGLPVEVSRSRVTVTTMDQWCERTGTRPDFIKVDVEGAEEGVLRGARQTMRTARPVMMVEITRNRQAVRRLVEGSEYVLLDEDLHPASLQEGCHNYFCVPVERAEELQLAD